MFLVVFLIRGFIKVRRARIMVVFIPYITTIGWSAPKTFAHFPLYDTNMTISHSFETIIKICFSAIFELKNDQAAMRSWLTMWGMLALDS